MKCVLVTGSGGFVGRALSETLLAKGLEVWGVDHRDVPAGRLAGMRVADLCEQSAVGGILDDIRPDGIVHLAAQASAGRSFDEPYFTIKNNVIPILHILEHLRVSGARDTRVVAIGSAEVYGPVEGQQLPIDESQTPNPLSPYALSKLLQEQCCAQYAALYGMNVVMTRSFNHTGAGQPDTYVLSSFARQIAAIRSGRGGSTVRVGNVDVRRDFLDVRDVCRAYTMLLETGRSGAVYNVCSGASHSLRELLEKLAAIAGVEIDIQIDESRLRTVDIEELYGDNRRIAADTGWTPEISLEKTLGGLLDYWSASDAPGHDKAPR